MFIVPFVLEVKSLHLSFCFSARANRITLEERHIIFFFSCVCFFLLEEGGGIVLDDANRCVETSPNLGQKKIVHGPCFHRHRVRALLTHSSTVRCVVCLHRVQRRREPGIRIRRRATTSRLLFVACVGNWWLSSCLPSTAKTRGRSDQDETREEAHPPESQPQ